jgi:carboxypeptidase C (cathepsin A)
LCDLAVPCDAMRHSVDHLRLDRALRDNITFAEYTSGHMMYLNLPDLARMEADLARFVSPP